MIFRILVLPPGLILNATDDRRLRRVLDRVPDLGVEISLLAEHHADLALGVGDGLQVQRLPDVEDDLLVLEPSSIVVRVRTLLS